VERLLHQACVTLLTADWSKFGFATSYLELNLPRTRLAVITMVMNTVKSQTTFNGV